MLILLSFIYINVLSVRLFSKIMWLIMSWKINFIEILCVLNKLWILILQNIGVVRIIFSMAFGPLYWLNIFSILKISYCQIWFRIWLKSCWGWWIDWKWIFRRRVLIILMLFFSEILMKFVVLRWWIVDRFGE